MKRTEPSVYRPRAVALRRMAALAGLILVGACQQEADPALDEQRSRSFILTTATTGGTYYPVGVAISTLVKLRLQEEHGISLSAINSAGSGENVKLLKSGEADFALMQGLYGVIARTGQGAYGRHAQGLNLRSITMLWPNVEHFAIATRFAKTGTMADLRTLGGAKYAIGNRNSGAMESTSMIFAALGIKPGIDLDYAYLGYSAGADALQNGTIAGFSAPAGAPVSAVARAFAAIGPDMRVLDFTDEDLAAINEVTDLWQRYVIKAGTYPGQDQPIKTASQPNFLAVNNSVDEEVVYRITRVIFENLPFLYSVHRATRSINLGSAIGGLPVPLHPGAIRYYLEQGIVIPPELIPEEYAPPSDEGVDEATVENDGSGS